MLAANDEKSPQPVAKIVAQREGKQSYRPVSEQGV
jgi:hypothetical protein